jgi:mannose-6-phosphate isomerase-like protein (cupin superfamily)
MSDKHSISEIAALIASPFVYLDLGSVNDHVVSLMRVEGSYPSHSHAKDEMYIVMEGEIAIQHKRGGPMALKQGESTVIKAYTEHFTASERGALVLVIKSKENTASSSGME